MGKDIGWVPVLVLVPQLTTLVLDLEPLVDVAASLLLAVDEDETSHVSRISRTPAECLMVGIGIVVRGVGLGICTAPRDPEPGTGEAVATVALKLTSDIGDRIESLTFVLVVILVVMAGDCDCDCEYEGGK